MMSVITVLQALGILCTEQCVHVCAVSIKMSEVSNISLHLKHKIRHICKYSTCKSTKNCNFNYYFCFLQYNEELHYVESCLNGTLVQADVPNKDVSLSLLFFYCFLLLLSFGNQLLLL